ncbi:putative bifunctional diguanylate cyclase/phosphodiesterase [Granulicella arctica]|uniref:putative bifunctional diguanylate cyclase/phosphodiesterase n=1 Tax=Granulicella arctica TaxID=940613 RepID=UPI0021DFB895|nr:bifunctional diguanylate cyclase/phosphodiesterase [Granulicella arctica]
MIHGTYNLNLVALSLVFSVLSSYTTLDVAARIRSVDLSGGRRTYWLLGGAMAMGLGIWSMHFIGMLAFQMPMQISYDPWLTAASLLIAILTAYFALHVTSRGELGARHLLYGGILMGFGIAAMHYTGMEAMQMYPRIQFDPSRFITSLAIALVASWAALWIAFSLHQDSQRHVFLKRCAAGLIMGCAIAGMHYVGMSAADFAPGSICRATSPLGMNWLLPITCVLSLSGLLVVLILSTLGTRFDLLLEDSHHSLDEANQQLKVLAMVDALTGIPNRPSFIQTMDQRLAAAKLAGTSFSVMFIDLDGFKTINDSLGHACGDELLICFATELVRHVRAKDTVARLGGDEFVVLLDGLSRSEDVVPIAKTVLDRMKKDFVIRGMPLRLTSSLGISTFPADGQTVSALLKNADMAMYDAKQHGKNAFRFFNMELSNAADRTRRIYRGLTEALEQRQFSLVFQPKFGGVSNKVVGAEVLIRWNHPEMGNIPPMDFIPVAEQTGQIVQISEWVICEVCRQMKTWELAGMPKIKIAINLSPEQLRVEGYVDRVASIIETAGIDPQWIMFEITETIAMREPEMAGEMIRAFQERGFDIAIDDFGTGYSSMAYLQKFRVTELKIDRFFTSALDDESEEGQAIVSAMIALAHSLHMVVVAEGVETAGQLKKLNDLNCDQMQGYFLARPMSPKAFEDLILTRPIETAPTHQQYLLIPELA